MMDSRLLVGQVRVWVVFMQMSKVWPAVLENHDSAQKKWCDKTMFSQHQTFVQGSTFGSKIDVVKSVIAGE